MISHHRPFEAPRDTAFRAVPLYFTIFLAYSSAIYITVRDKAIPATVLISRDSDSAGIAVDNTAATVDTSINARNSSDKKLDW